MRKATSGRGFGIICAAVCLTLAACGSGPSSSGRASSARAEAATLERKIAHLEGLLARRSQAAGVLDALTAALPDRVWITEAAYDAGKGRVKGAAPSNDILADYIARLGESPSLANLTLGGSVLKTVKGRERVEFALNAVAWEAIPDPAASAAAAPAARLEELEKALPSRQDSSATLREIQRLALDSGLQMTKFAPEAEVSGEFTTALPVALELSGSLNELGRFLPGLAGLPGLWVADRFSLKAAQPDDPRSPFRASIAARGYFKR